LLNNANLSMMALELLSASSSTFSSMTSHAVESWASPANPVSR
jgi:hypothetical protein